MEVRETITLAGQPFSTPLPRSAGELIAFFASHGQRFQDMGRTLVLNESFEPNRLPHVDLLARELNLNLKIDHSVWTVYDDSDYQRSSLWILYFPDVWIREINFVETCQECGKRSIIIDTKRKVSQVNSQKPIVSVNGQFPIIHHSLYEIVRTELSGALLEPFDRKERYFYLLAESHLGKLINTCNDFIGAQSPCPLCGEPRFEIFYAPYCYSKESWNGDDVVSGDFHNGLFFTSKAYQVLNVSASNVSRGGVVLLK